jgi:hypothetical protein
MCVARALAAVLSMWNLQVIILSKMTSRYFTIFTREMFLPFSCSTSSGILNPSEEIDHLSFPFIDLYVPARPCHSSSG